MRIAPLVAVSLGLFAACACDGRAAAAPTPVPSPQPSASATPTMSPEFNRVDVVTLMATVIEELRGYQGQILVETKASSAMPPWDPLVFYAGIGADKHQPFRPVVWTIEQTKAKGYDHALLRAYVMGVMDTGEAGPKFKKAYDVAAGEDQTLPSDVPDPYLNRHAVAEPFVAELMQTAPPR